MQEEFQEPELKKSIKRIVAKEGLIIVVIVSIGMALFLLGEKIKFTKPVPFTPLYDTTEGLTKEDVLKCDMLRDDEKEYLLHIVNFGNYRVKSMHKRITDSEIKKELSIAKLIGAPELDWDVILAKINVCSDIAAQRQYEKNCEKYLGISLLLARIRQLGLFLIWLGYPIHLLIRFILWAVRTLREK